MRQQHNCNIKTVTTTICSEKRNNSCGGCLWNCVDFHFQHTRRWHAHCARSPGFSHWLRYNFRFFNSLSFFFSLVDFYFFFYRLCGALPQNVSVGFVVLVVVVAVVSATESVGVDFYLYLRSLVQHYTSKVGSGLVWLAWLKCYLPDRLSDWQTDGQPDCQRCLPSSVSASDSAWAWLAGWLVGASLNRFLLRLSFRFVFISIY